MPGKVETVAAWSPAAGRSNSARRTADRPLPIIGRGSGGRRLGLRLLAGLVTGLPEDRDQGAADDRGERDEAAHEPAMLVGILSHSGRPAWRDGLHFA